MIGQWHSYGWKLTCRAALERQEFACNVTYCVSFRLAVVGFNEALQHPQHGPEPSCAAAEETGLLTRASTNGTPHSMLAIRNWQLKLPEIPSLIISVNLSGKQFSS